MFFASPDSERKLKLVNVKTHPSGFQIGK